MKNLLLIFVFALFCACSSKGDKFVGSWVAQDGSELSIIEAGENAYSITAIGANNGSAEGTFGAMFRGKSTMSGVFEDGLIKADMGILISYDDGKVIYNGQSYSRN